MDRNLIIGIPKESKEGEKRVAFAPETVKKAVKKGFTVLIESGAGQPACGLDLAPDRRRR